MSYKIPAVPMSYQSSSYKSYDEVELHVEISIAGRLRLSFMDNDAAEAMTVALTKHEVQEMIWQLQDALREAKGA
jgi:hypothetical protein